MLCPLTITSLHSLFFLFFCPLSLFLCSHSGTVILVILYKGEADPIGWPVVCMSLIKYSFIIGAAPSHPPFLLSLPVMHSGLLNYSGVYRSGGSCPMSSSVRTYKHKWHCIQCLCTSDLKCA